MTKDIKAENLILDNFKTGIKIGFVSLGCDKNRVDLETMINALLNSGYEIVDENEADVLVINTCAFILDARKEAVSVILEAISRKQTDKNLKIVVSGCLPEIKGENLYEILPEVDLFVKIKEQNNIVNLIDKVCKVKRAKKEIEKPFYVDGERYISTIGGYAYLKISEGCDNFCSYCMIPYIRGRFVSKPFDNVILEAKNLVKAGITEIILVGQDVTRYGADFKNGKGLVDLLQELEKIDGLKWIRLLYCYPDLITDKLIDLIAKSKKICKYIDVPMQHISNNILAKMNRRETKEQIVSIVQKLKSANIKIRSTFIVGFPNETHNDFVQIKQFLKEYKLDNVGFFKYSKEEGTAAAKFKKQKSKLTKFLRFNSLYKLQNKIRQENNYNQIGQTFNAVCQNKLAENIYEFRTEFNAPEIDETILVEVNKEVIIGEYLDVLITGLNKSGLIGQVVEDDNNEFTK